MSEAIVIDGSYGEGGGQVIRTSLALSAISGRPVEIFNIRGKRAKPGLQAQHLKCVHAAAEICGAEVRGDKLQSQSLRFRPQHKTSPGEYRFDIGTAGSTTLVLQTILVPLVIAGGGSQVTITGGTHNPMAPCTDYLEAVFLPAMSRMGAVSSVSVPSLGFYPVGGGKLTCVIEPCRELRGINLEMRGPIVRQVGRVIVANLSEDIARRGRQDLAQSLPSVNAVEIVEGSSPGAGAAVFIASQYQHAFGGFTGIGERKKWMGAVVEEAVIPFLAWESSQATVDEHLADQLILPAVFAEGSSRWRTSVVTEHLRTVVWLVKQFVDRSIEIDEREGWVTVGA
jgi:RNA 3'-terminal phosphate cyclase (ATP)